MKRANSFNRLLATLWTDVRLQVRNGFYYVVAFMILVWAILFSQLPEVDLAWILPALVLGNLVMNTFYFIGGLVLLEKDEGTLEAQVVTPLRTWEYLASKVITLAGLSLVENVLIVIILNGLNFRALPFIVGVVAASAIYALVGFVAVSRYASINEYLMPSVVYTMAFALPFLNYFGLWESWLVYLHPLQAPLLVLQAAFLQVETWQLVYGVLYSALWIGLTYIASRRAFMRFIVAGGGVG